MIYAVIDTNVLVSALFTHNADAATARVIEALMEGRFVPLYNEEIIDEYNDVLHRAKFMFPQWKVDMYLEVFHERGVRTERVTSNEFLPDPSDVVFYEVALSKVGSYLVTGNQKHFPRKPLVVTPAEMMDILDREESKEKEVR